MDDRDKALHKFLMDLDRYELVNVTHQGGSFEVALSKLPIAPVESDEADEVTDELLESALAFLNACKDRDEGAIASTAKGLEGSIDLQVTTDFLTEARARSLIRQLQDIADGSKWGADGKRIDR